jgi:hypothetical protein
MRHAAGIQGSCASRLTAASPDARTLRFREWLSDNPHLSLHDVAAYLRRSIKTVEMWRRGSPRAIPDNMLRLLILTADRISKVVAA